MPKRPARCQGFQALTGESIVVGLREAEQRGGHDPLRTNRTGEDPAVLWARHAPLTEIEAVFRSLQREWADRPVSHRLDHRGDARVLVAFLAYGLPVTRKNRLPVEAPGFAPMEKLASLPRIDVRTPTRDGRHLLLPRYTQPE